MNIAKIISGEYIVRITINAKTIEGIDKDYITDFSSKQMTGNPYCFETFFQQEKLFEFSSEIIGINSCSYEIIIPEGNKFITEDSKEYIYSPTQEKIIVQDLYICGGYDQDDFKETQAFVYLLPGFDTTFKAPQDSTVNNKTFGTRFIYYDAEQDRSKVIWQYGAETTIQWYKYEIGAADLGAGVYWAKMLSLTPTGQNEAQALDNAINFEFTPGEITIQFDENSQRGTYFPDVAEQQEYLRVLITHDGETYLAEAPVLQNADYVVNKEITQLNLDTLKITIVDEGREDGYYNIFDLSNKSLEPSNKFRQFTVNTLDGTEIPEGTEFTWTFPRVATMIEPYSIPDDYNGMIITNTPNIRYRINQFYAENRTNNTVRCSCMISGRQYQGHIDLRFGRGSASGTDYAFNIVPVDNNKQYIINEDGATLDLQVKLEDAAGNDQDLTNAEIIWSWFYVTPGWASDYGEELLKLQDILDSNNQKIQNQIRVLYPTRFDDINNFYILQAKITVDFIPLTSYYPIVIKAPDVGNNSYAYINGATVLPYSHDGTLQNNNDLPYALYNKNHEEITGLTWSLSYTDETLSDYYYINNKKLVAPETYLGEEKYPGISLKVTDGFDNLLWCQPILIYQDTYPYEALNNWVGGIVEVNEEDGYIISKMIGAGEKDANNRFSGVLMGKIGAKNETEIGLFGFNKGTMKFKLDAKTGDAIFAGTLKGVSGTFTSISTIRDWKNTNIYYKLQQNSTCGEIEKEGEFDRYGLNIINSFTSQHTEEVYQGTIWQGLLKSKLFIGSRTGLNNRSNGSNAYNQTSSHIIESINSTQGLRIASQNNAYFFKPNYNLEEQFLETNDLDIASIILQSNIQGINDEYGFPIIKGSSAIGNVVISSQETATSGRDVLGTNIGLFITQKEDATLDIDYNTIPSILPLNSSTELAGILICEKGPQYDLGGNITSAEYQPGIYITGPVYWRAGPGENFTPWR